MRPFNEGENAWTMKDLAQALNLSVASIWRYRKKGLIHFYQVGGRYFSVETLAQIREVLEKNVRGYTKHGMTKNGVDKKEYQRLQRATRTEEQRQKQQGYQHQYYMDVTKPKRKARKFIAKVNEEGKTALANGIPPEVERFFPNMYNHYISKINGG
jgi:hypothetical protein